MNTRRIWLTLAAASVLLLAVSCNKKKVEKVDEPVGGSGDVLVSATIKNADGASGSSYIRLIPSTETKYDNSNSIQVGFGATICILGNDIYVFPEDGPNGKQAITKYTRSDKGLTQTGELRTDPGSYAINLAQVTPEKLYINNYMGGYLTIANAKTFEQIGKIDISSYAYTDNSPNASQGIMRDGLYYLTLNQGGDNWMPYEGHRCVDVLIIDPKTDKVQTLISEKESGLCFPTRPFLKNMIFTTEANDIYIACTGYFGYNPQYLKSGFVCIPSGTQAFDASRSWDISQTTIEGTNYKPSSLYNTKYIGNNLVAAYVGILELSGSNPYTARNSMAVLIDLKARTIKQIAGIPLTDGHSVAIEMHGDEVIFSAFGKDNSGLFAFNPKTMEVRQTLKAAENINFVHFF